MIAEALAVPGTETQVLAAAHDAQITANGLGLPGWTSAAAGRRIWLLFGRALSSAVLLAALDQLAARGDVVHTVSDTGVSLYRLVALSAAQPDPAVGGG
jgi:hypothetical protein